MAKLKGTYEDAERNCGGTLVPTPNQPFHTQGNKTLTAKLQKTEEEASAVAAELAALSKLLTSLKKVYPTRSS